MNEDEIRKALAEGKIPINTFDKAFIAMMTIFACVILYFSIKTYVKWGFATMLWSLFIGIFFGSLMCYQALWNKKQLLQYKSSLPYDKKVEVLEKLLTEPDLKPISKFWVTKTPNFYGFNYDKGFLSNYSITVLYNESMYYVSSIKGTGRSAWFSNVTANEIIDRIKKIEADL